MGPENQTCVSKFFLLGLSEKPEQDLPLFELFLGMYMVSVVGNLIITLAIGSDPHLHTPMYFFLSNLSLLDVCLVTTLVPKMLVNLLTHNNTVSYAECFAQMYFFMIFICSEMLLLTVMAYDRFVAIWHPLHYVTIRSQRNCGLLVLLAWTTGLMASTLHILMLMQLCFCTERDISHFFFDLSEVIKLSCSNSLINTILEYLFTGLLGVLPFTVILFSYAQIFSSILKVPTARGKYKALSTCGSHLSVVSLFFGTGLGVYLSSSVTHSSWETSVASIMYSVVNPILNPFIYSLRNKDIKEALRRFISKTATSQ